MILPQTSYEQDTITVAKGLLGCYLVHLEGEETTLRRIVEEDKTCFTHSWQWS